MNGAKTTFSCSRSLEGLPILAGPSRNPCFAANSSLLTEFFQGIIQSSRVLEKNSLICEYSLQHGLGQIIVTAYLLLLLENSQRRRVTSLSVENFSLPVQGS